MMKILCLLLIVFDIGFLQPVYSFPSNQVIKIDSTLSIIKNRKTFIDKYVKRHLKEIRVFVKVPHKNNLVQVKNDKWPEQVEYTFNILKSKTGKIIFIAKIPYSESGDWDIEYKHYFDEQGNTFAFNEVQSVFNDAIKGGVIRKTNIKYYDLNFICIHQVHGFTNKDGLVIQKNNEINDFPDFKYSIYKNLSECLKGYHINHFE